MQQTLNKSNAFFTFLTQKPVRVHYLYDNAWIGIRIGIKVLGKKSIFLVRDIPNSETSEGSYIPSWRYLNEIESVGKKKLFE